MLWKYNYNNKTIQLPAVLFYQSRTYREKREEDRRRDHRWGWWWCMREWGGHKKTLLMNSACGASVSKSTCQPVAHWPPPAAPTQIRVLKATEGLQGPDSSVRTHWNGLCAPSWLGPRVNSGGAVRCLLSTRARQPQSGPLWLAISPDGRMGRGSSSEPWRLRPTSGPPGASSPPRALNSLKTSDTPTYPTTSYCALLV